MQVVRLDLDMVDKIWPRIEPFLKEYHRQGMYLGARSPAMGPGHEEFGLKELAISLYQQGLMDAVELHKKGELDKIDFKE